MCLDFVAKVFFLRLYIQGIPASTTLTRFQKELNAAFERTEPAKHVPCMHDKLHNTFLQVPFLNLTLRCFGMRIFNYILLQTQVSLLHSTETKTTLYHTPFFVIQTISYQTQ